MATMPGYIKVGEVKAVDGALHLSLSVNRWHPAFWLLYLRVFIKTLSGIRVRRG